LTENVHAATPKNLRVFGIGLGFILCAFGLLAWRKASPSMPYLFGAAAVFASLGLAWPMALNWVYIPWMKVVGVIGAANQFLLMALTFYLVFTPYRIVMTLFGKDPLDRTLGSAESYWKEHEPVEDPGSYERQF